MPFSEAKYLFSSAPSTPPGIAMADSSLPDSSMNDIIVKLAEDRAASLPEDRWLSVSKVKGNPLEVFQVTGDRLRGGDLIIHECTLLEYINVPRWTSNL
nr:hypothetical protein Iba_chr13bCG0190 [Ipomoea batatas]GMD80400.1 hypothetical protein Iba_chr13eCG1500 [Ipomoea batatas]